MSPRFPRKEKYHDDAESNVEELAESKQASDISECSSEHPSNPEIVLCDDGYLQVETPSKDTLKKSCNPEIVVCDDGLLTVKSPPESPSENGLKKSWSPRFLRKRNCHEEISSSKQISGSFSEHPSNPEIVVCDDGLLTVKSPPESPSENGLKKSWSPRFLRKRNCHEDISSSKQFSGSSSEHPSNPEIVVCDDGLLSVKSPNESALKKSWSPRFLRKRQCCDIAKSNGGEISADELTGSESESPTGWLVGSKHRRNAICAALMPAEHLRAIPYLELLSVLSGTDLI
ncbi:hypothetical protein ACROYT_G003111 [Oculina patagonica]